MRARFKSLFCPLQSFLMQRASHVASDVDAKLRLDRAALSLTGNSNVSFPPIAAASLRVSEAEKARCRAWFDLHLRASDDPAYDFSVGGLSFRSHRADWLITVGKESANGEIRRGGKTTIVTLRHKKSDLTAQVEATIYEAYATCEWTVRIRNEGEAPSPLLRRFYAADCMLDSAQTTLYVSRGSLPAADDFELVQMPVGPTTMAFSADGGRNDSFLPFFNLSGQHGGAVLAVGWTGQWLVSLRQTGRGAAVRAKQQFFRARLESGESVRTPLVSLTFYDGANALKGFDVFRRLQTDCLCPAALRPMNGYMIATEFSTATCDELIDRLRAMDDAALDSVDYFWMDAGWYNYQKSWYDGVGHWKPDPARFPRTLKPLSDEMAKRGKRFLLWYEPERVRENTALWKVGMQHSGWIVQDGENLMWNLANDDACDYLADYISASLLENGVSFYRQDFNFRPLDYWRKADRTLFGGRRGICENRYVTNLYRYLDTLLSRVPGLLIDNCASGGKRLDLEMNRRSLPLWRSDYNCRTADGEIRPDLPEATQAMTFGASFWLPYSGTNPFADSEYAVRSAMLTHPSFADPYPAGLADYREIRDFMTAGYFPLTYGGADSMNYHAMQFGSEQAGAALIYRRAHTAESRYLLRLNGLSPEKTYILTDLDNAAFRVETTGRALMETGVELTIHEAPKAAIVRYTAKD